MSLMVRCVDIENDRKIFLRVWSDTSDGSSVWILWNGDVRVMKVEGLIRFVLDCRLMRVTACHMYSCDRQQLLTIDRQGLG